MKYAIHVTLDAPAGIDPLDMADYVAEAVRSWSLGGDPDSPLWNIDYVKATCRGISAITSRGY